MCAKITEVQFEQRKVYLHKRNIEIICEYKDNKGMDAKYHFHCAIDEHEWDAKFANVFSSGQGCPKCGILSSTEKKRTTESDFNQIKK